MVMTTRMARLEMEMTLSNKLELCTRGSHTGEQFQRVSSDNTKIDCFRLAHWFVSDGCIALHWFVSDDGDGSSDDKTENGDDL